MAIPPDMVDHRMSHDQLRHYLRNKRCLLHPKMALILVIDPKTSEYVPKCGRCWPDPPSLETVPNRADERMEEMVQRSIATMPEPQKVEQYAKEVGQFLAPQATQTELQIFARYCMAQGLNAFAKEAYLIPFKDTKSGTTRHVIVTGIGGYLKKASHNPAYLMYQSGLIVQRGTQYTSIPGTALFPGDVLFGAWCKVYKKGSPMPFEHQVALDDWRKPGFGLWGRQDNVMIEVTAVRQCIRRAFPDEFGPEGEDAEYEGMAVVTIPEEALGSTALPAMATASPVSESMICPIHNTKWFMSGRMREHAHVIEGKEGPKGGKVWCNMAEVQAQQPQDAPQEAQQPLAEGTAEDSPTADPETGVIEVSLAERQQDLVQWAENEYGIDLKRLLLMVGKESLGEITDLKQAVEDIRTTKETF